MVDDKQNASPGKSFTHNKAKENARYWGYAPQYRALRFLNFDRSLSLRAGELAAKQRHASQTRGQQNERSRFRERNRRSAIAVG